MTEIAASPSLRFQLPWVRRANLEKAKRQASEAKLAQVMYDWRHVAATTDAVKHEAQLNDWTNTAKLLFTGTDGNKT